eukprot:SAG31_NODE_1009_length_10404_cov_27.639981_11_plen_105_part_00
MQWQKHVRAREGRAVIVAVPHVCQPVMTAACIDHRYQNTGQTSVPIQEARASHRQATCPAQDQARVETKSGTAAQAPNGTQSKHQLNSQTEDGASGGVPSKQSG